MQNSLKNLAVDLNGLLAFVTTPFGPEGEIAPHLMRLQLERLLHAYARVPAGLFVCCGAGELGALDLSEYRALVATAVEVAGGAVPVFAGVGYGTRLAEQFARAASAAGADGVLIFPPYLAEGPQEGLFRHYGAVAAATDGAVIVYNRAQARFEPDTVRRLVDAHRNIIGLKDGLGDMRFLTAVRAAMGEAFLLVNGMPCAEAHAPAFRAAGIAAYSPSGIDFFPELAWAYEEALERGDAMRVERMLERFYRPYAAMRGLVPGYGIALSKAARGLRGLPAGGVRPPLVDPSREHLAGLADLLAQAEALLQEDPCTTS